MFGLNADARALLYGFTNLKDLIFEIGKPHGSC